jgi:hypothetical protein
MPANSLSANYCILPKGETCRQPDSKTTIHEIIVMVHRAEWLITIILTESECGVLRETISLGIPSDIW